MLKSEDTFRHHHTYVVIKSKKIFFLTENRQNSFLSKIFSILYVVVVSDISLSRVNFSSYDIAIRFARAVTQ